MGTNIVSIHFEHLLKISGLRRKEIDIRISGALRLLPFVALSSWKCLVVHYAKVILCGQIIIVFELKLPIDLTSKCKMS